MSDDPRGPIPPVLSTGQLRRCFRLFGREWKLFAWVLVCLLGLSLLQLPGPVLTMRIIDAVNHPDGSTLTSSIHLLAAALLVTLLAQRAIRIVQRYAVERFSYRITFGVQRDLLRHVLKLPMAHHLRWSPGYLLARVNEEPYRIQGIMTDTVLSLVGDILTLIVGAGFLLYLDWRLAALSLAVLPFLVVLFLRMRTSLKDDFRAVQESSARVGSQLGESLASVLTLKVFAVEKLAEAKFVRAASELVRGRFRILRRRMIYENVIGLLTGVVPIVILWLGAFEILHGRLSVGEFIAFNGLLAYLYRPAEGIVIALLSMQGSISAVERVFEILDLEPERYQPVGGGPRRLSPPEAGLAIELCGVSFRYPGKEDWVLHQASFSVRRGELVAVTGPSGVGKTTLLSLIPRLAEAEAGKVFVDGMDVATLELRALRRRVPMVSLETRLFSASVLDNIRFGRRGFSRGEVAEAARIACADEFIVRLPEGYDTRLGETGLDLSAGQRQRLLIARAILGRPAFLILDEATAFLDPELEARVLANLRDWMRGRTVLCVSHRPSIAAFADRIFTLSGGRISEVPPAALTGDPSHSLLPALQSV